MGTVDLLEILAPGILASLQDTGRPGYGRIGVAPSGAADSYACRIGNLLAGNLENAAALEITLMGMPATVGVSRKAWPGSSNSGAVQLMQA